MNKIDLKLIEHNVKIGDYCDKIEPSIKEDCLFMLDGKPIGFYLKTLPEKACKLAEIANREFRSNNVKKSTNNRVNGVQQFSTIIGSIADNARVGRNYKCLSSVHRNTDSNDFIKAMYLLAKESEKLISEIIPEQYEAQKEIFKSVMNDFKLGEIFTSSISNYNISASYHKDNANIKNTVNAIITKRKMAEGGCLNVPDYGITIEQADNSILVYPAWANVHGVTPIVRKHKDGYRNSFIFYPLKAFVNGK